VNIFYTDHYVLPLPPGHRFPMGKYALLRQRVSEAHGAWAAEMHIPPAATDDDLLRAHDADYVQRVQQGLLTAKEVRRIGFPWSAAMVERSRRSTGATIEACRAALRDGVAVNLAGGTHHAFREHGEGYCVFNDSIVAARVMQAEARATRVILIDCDVHQGNGSAALAAEDDSIFTFSMHGAKNFPFHKERSDLDVELDDGTGDTAYLEALDQHLRYALAVARADLAIYLAGADPFEGDTLGRLSLTKAGLAQRDQRVFQHCQSVGLPMAITMAGGYAKHVEDTVDIHFQTVQAAAQLGG
jgi:acetoin utilization deacetylase AcuC-like enzyme